MNLMTQYAAFMVKRYSLLNLLALTLLVASIGIFFILSLPTHHRLAQAEQHASAMQHAVSKRETVKVSDAPESMLNAFYSGLPAEAELSNQLELLFDTAFENDIYLDGIDYQFSNEKSGRLSRYRITLPVTGSYINIRKFLKKILEKAPNASLDSIALSREAVNDSDINAKLQITLYVRALP